MKGAVRFIFFTSILALGHFASSQTVLRRELSVEADNDAYTLNLTRDQYYSNGVAIKYRRLMDSSRWKPKHQKVIRSYYINHRMYTPKRLYWTDTAQMDRPYAGHLTLAISNEYYFKNSSYLQARFEAGWMGPSIIASLHINVSSSASLLLLKGAAVPSPLRICSVFMYFLWLNWVGK